MTCRMPPCVAVRCFASALVLGLAGCNGGVPPESEVAYCATEAAVPTTGGDHGEPWAPPTASLDPGIKLDIGIPPDVNGDLAPQSGGQDPTDWVREGMLVYRSPTNSEMERNDWDARMLLVVPSATELSALTNGALTSSLHLPEWELGDRPLTGLRITEFELARQGSQVIPFLLTEYRESTVTRTALTPTVNFYSTPDLESGPIGDAALLAVASERGGIDAQGFLTATRFTLRGPYPSDDSVLALELPPPGGGPIWLLNSLEGSLLDEYSETIEINDRSRGPHALTAISATPEPPRLAVGLNCNDGYDNDLDGVGDACDFNCAVHPDMGGLVHPHTALDEYGKAFAVIGDPGFCDSNPGNWVESLASWSGQAEQYLNSVVVPDEVKAEFPAVHLDAIRTPPFKARLKECIALGSKQLADACHDDEEECPELYPFAGDTGNWEAQLSQAWAALDHTVSGRPASQVHPVSIVAIATGYASPPGPGQIGGEIVGRGVFPTSPDVNRLGAAIFRILPPDEEHQGAISPGIALAHEIGHTVGLADEIGGEGFMRGDGGGYYPTLTWAFPSVIPNSDPDPMPGDEFLSHAEVWGYLVSDKWLPRPSGFKATLCEDDSDCTFPGTACVESYQWCR
jgi:hypothetical protein